MCHVNRFQISLTSLSMHKTNGPSSGSFGTQCGDHRLSFLHLFPIANNRRHSKKQNVGQVFLEASLLSLAYWVKRLAATDKKEINHFTVPLWKIGKSIANSHPHNLLFPPPFYTSYWLYRNHFRIDPENRKWTLSSISFQLLSIEWGKLLNKMLEQTLQVKREREGGFKSKYSPPLLGLRGLCI